MQATDMNNGQFVPGSSAGHYESYFLRANTDDGRAFWIRYTLFAPKGQPDKTEGELWCMVFRPGHEPAVGKTEFSLTNTHFERTQLGVDLGGSTLSEGHAKGHILAQSEALRHVGAEIKWDVGWDTSNSAPIWMFDPIWYGRPFPKAKAVTPHPLVRYR